MLDAWASMTANVPGCMDLPFAHAVATERARRTGRRQRVVVNRGHACHAWKYAIVDAEERRCACGAPDATSLRAGEVLVHRAGTCYFALEEVAEPCS